MGQLDNTIVVFTTDNGAEAITFPDGGVTPFKGQKGEAWEGGFRAPCVVRWPGHIKPGTVKNKMFAVSRLGAHAGRHRGRCQGRRAEEADRGRQRILASSRPRSTASTSGTYLEGTTRQVGARHLLLLLRRDAVRGALQELEDVLHDVPRPRGGGLDPAAHPVPLHPGPEHQARSFRAGGRHRPRRRPWAWAARWPRPMTAYIYDWNMLPIGQLLVGEGADVVRHLPAAAGAGDLQPERDPGADQESGSSHSSD